MVIVRSVQGTAIDMSCDSCIPGRLVMLYIGTEGVIEFLVLCCMEMMSRRLFALGVMLVGKAT